MRAARFFDLALVALAAVLAVGGVPAMAQEVVQAPTPDADALASEMRLLADNPTDLGAMIRAGELTLKLGDATAAAGFFARAERIDPNNPRIKVGKGTLLVDAGQPGAALIQFRLAEQSGYDPRHFAADRGLAYDLIGEQERAQRDYRLALKDSPSSGSTTDEILRRYALSLGISGRRDEALEQIDALVRRSDRAAWRTRAFVLAMSGDARAAAAIATNMMPGGLGQGLQPFFERLPKLSPTDRAFAVHFGETRPTPQRIADARLVPPFSYLPPEAGRDAERKPVVTAALVSTEGKKKKPKRERGNRDRQSIQIAAVQSPAPLPPPPAYQGAEALAMNTAPAPIYVQPLPPRPSVPAATSAYPAYTPSPAFPARATSPGFAGLTPDPVPEVVSQPQPQPQPQPPPQSVAVAAPVPLPPVPGPAKREDTILAKIIANITVPGSELDVPPVEPEPEPEPEPVADVAAVRSPVAMTEPASMVAAQKAADTLANDKQSAGAKKAADAKKLVEAKKLADAKRAEELKKKRDPKLLEPSRLWVQVAGGSNEATLPKEWARARDKAPAAFKGKVGWTTPLRATNRVLAGPFKTDDEARRFVNALAKEGVSAFTFTSDAGQKITKLATK